MTVSAYRLQTAFPLITVRCKLVRRLNLLMLHVTCPYRNQNNECGDGVDYVCCLRDNVTTLGCGYFSPYNGLAGDNQAARLGEPVDESSMPWVTLIDDISSDKVLGTGTLIHPGAILTTASILQG